MSTFLIDLFTGKEFLFNKTIAPSTGSTGGGETTRDVTSMLTVGNIKPNDIIPTGTDLTEFLEKLLLTIFNPTYTAPSFSLSTTPSAAQEVGTITNITLTGTFNRGNILGALSGGTWNAGLSQGQRAGAATKYILNGVDNGVTNNITISNYQISGDTTFTGNTSYSAGIIAVNSNNIPVTEPTLLPAQLPSGTTTTSTTTILGRRKLFYGLNQNVTNSSEIRLLSNSLVNPQNGTTFTITIPAGSTKVAFSYPATLRDVNSVKYVENSNSEVKASFDLTLVNVEGANGFTAISHKTYEYVPAIPPSSTMTYNVTI